MRSASPSRCKPASARMSARNLLGRACEGECRRCRECLRRADRGGQIVAEPVGANCRCRRGHPAEARRTISRSKRPIRRRDFRAVERRPTIVPARRRSGRSLRLWTATSTSPAKSATLDLFGKHARRTDVANRARLVGVALRRDFDDGDLLAEASQTLGDPIGLPPRKLAGAGIDSERRGRRHECILMRHRSAGHDHGHSGRPARFSARAASLQVLPVVRMSSTSRTLACSR